MTTKEKVEVMKAYAEGKKIQYKLSRSSQQWDDWTLPRDPSWNWDELDFRIKPEHTYRPYKDTEEMIEDFRKKVGMGKHELFLPSVWVKRKDDSDFAKLITEFGYSCVWLSINRVGISMSKLFQDYTYLDGSPCGIK